MTFSFKTEIGKAHDAQTHRSRAMDHVVDLGQRPGLGIDHVVEKTSAEMRHFTQPIPIDPFFRIVKLREIDRTELHEFEKCRNCSPHGLHE